MDLGVLYVYAEDVPNSGLLNHIRGKFAPELSRHLRSKGISEHFISGVDI